MSTVSNMVSTIVVSTRTSFPCSTFTFRIPYTCLSRNVNVKREDYIDWDDYFMATAFLAAKRSKDPSTQVGACIVNSDNIIVGVGYNGFPKGCHDDAFPWAKNSASPLENKYLYVCHAEMNAILNRNTSDTKGCRMFVALFPCNECAKLIIQSGIKEVIYMSDKNFSKMEAIATRKMFDAVGIIYRQLIPKQRKIVIDFDEINWNAMSQLSLSPGPKNPANLQMNEVAVGSPSPSQLPAASLGKEIQNERLSQF